MRSGFSAPRFPALLALFCLGVALVVPASAQEADPRVVVFHFTPTKRTQLALWIEKPDGTFLKTLRLTQAVSYRGIGNRPGASQMNSGYRWPYGRREGVLPVWAHRRAAAAGAMPFRRVIFQNRTSEGHASRSTSDASPDDYFCLSFNDSTTKREGLDAVSCASRFNSDKGRFIAKADIDAGYGEPQEDPNTHEGSRLPLSAASFYPPRRDAMRCEGTGCDDTADVALYAEHARTVMPDLDAVTMATPTPDLEQTIYFTVPDDWPDGDYVAWLEANTEGDYNGVWNDTTFPTPRQPMGSWDSWAITYGYPFRGQPSVVYKVAFKVGVDSTTSTNTPAGYGSLSGQGPDGGRLFAMDGQISVDPITAPGSGADRMRLAGHDYRLQAVVRGAEFCTGNMPPGKVDGLVATTHADEKHSHEWGRLAFVVPQDDKGISRVEVRVGTSPITDEESFMRAQPALAATRESQELVIPSTTSGTPINVEFGGLMALTHYYIGVRAIDSCNQPGPIAVTEIQTTTIRFTKLSGCFIATAAWGTPMADEINGLRKLRDRHLRASALGDAFIELYERAAPTLADHLRPHEGLRAGVRELLGPLAALAEGITPAAAPPPAD